MVLEYYLSFIVYSQGCFVDKDLKDIGINLFWETICILPVVNRIVNISLHQLQMTNYKF